MGKRCQGPRAAIGKTGRPSPPPTSWPAPETSGRGEGWRGIAAAAAPALRDGRKGGREGAGGTTPHHSYRYGPSLPLSPPLHRPGLGHPQILSPPLAPTPRLRQRHSHPPPPLPQPGWGGGQPPRPPTPLRWGQERDGRRREEGAERDVEEGMGERLGLGGRAEETAGGKRRADWGEGCWGKERRPEKEERRRPCAFGMGCGQGILQRECPTPSPIPFLALWPHLTLGGLGQAEGSLLPFFPSLPPRRICFLGMPSDTSVSV